MPVTRRRAIAAFAGVAIGGLDVGHAFAARTTVVPLGAGTVEVAGAAPDGSSMTVWTYRPDGHRPDDRIVFVMHGVLRNASVYRDDWIALAKQYRFLVVVPEMTKQQFPGDAGYNFGNTVDAAGQPQPSTLAAWNSIEKIFDAVRTGSGSSRETYAIFGHSAGAQFVHRMVLFAEHPRLDAAIAGNAGWYTLPVFTEAFPYGLQGGPIGAARARAAFAKPLVVLLGEADTDRAHKYLRHDAGSDRQGLNRLERGRTFFSVATAEAGRLGVPLAWKIETVPGVGHSNKGMMTAAARWLFLDR